MTLQPDDKVVESLSWNRKDAWAKGWMETHNHWWDETT